MSADKRKRFQRACDLLREVNNGRYLPPTLSGHGRWSLRNPTIRYIVDRGMAKLKRVRGTFARNHTVIDTGVPWARQYRPEDDR